jgi:hypothetical protein
MVAMQGEEEVGHAEGGEEVLKMGGSGRVCLVVGFLLLLWVLHICFYVASVVTRHGTAHDGYICMCVCIS